MPVPHHAPGLDPARADPRRHCRRCRYQLAGLHTVSGRLTCPECGLTGTWAEVLPPGPSSQPSWLRSWLLMCAPPAACLALAIAVSLAGVDADSVMALVLLAIVTGLLAPLVVAGYVIDREEDSFRGVWLFLVTLLMGWASNVMITMAITVVADMTV